MADADNSSRVRGDLTPLGTMILEADRDVAYRALVVHTTDFPPASKAAAALQRVLTPGELLAGTVRSPLDAECVLAGLWLWHDCLDQSHTISQRITTESGSYWHAVLHRREGDFSNAKYWYARCRHHPVRSDLPVLIESNLSKETGLRGAERFIRSGWDAEGFVDFVEEVHRKPGDLRAGLAVSLQRIEWHALFEHCVKAAVGRPEP